jgi:diguanylate cyclase (GGDEF)-like protein/PAS domain S-box-containing protein
MQVLDTAPEAAFDDLVALASRIAGVPTALVSLIDSDRQWFKARIGFEAISTSRDVAFCEHVVREAREVETTDARTDPRFHDSPLVTGDPHIVFYSGFPLRTVDDHIVGTLCVIGYEPNELDEEQRFGLRVLAAQVTTQLELRRQTAQQADEMRARLVLAEELLASQQAYQLLAEHSSDIISRHLPDGRVTYVSPSVQSVLGYDPLEEVSENAIDHLHPADAMVMREALGEVMRGQTRTVTVRSQHADGRWRWMEVTLKPLVDPAGGLVEIYSAARDITERVLAWQEVARSSEFTRVVLDSIDVGIVACDADGHLTLFNPATTEWHGLPPDGDLPADQWSRHFDLYQPDGVTLLDATEVPLYRALKEGHVTGLEMVIAPHGKPARHVRCDGRALHDPDGAVIGAVVAMSDLTPERRALQAVAHERSRLAEAQRVGQLGSFDYDPATDIFRTSDQLRLIWGVSGSSTPFSDWKALICGEDHALATQSFQAALDEGGRHEFTYRISRARDGEQRDIRAIVEVITGADGAPVAVYGTHQDITETARASRAAGEANAFLSAVMAASPDFTFVRDLDTGDVVFSSGASPVGTSGPDLQQLGGAGVAAMVHPEDRPQLAQAQRAARQLKDGEVLQLRYRAQHADHSWRWLHRRITPFRRDASGAVREVLGVARDITDIVEVEQRLTHAALHDHLTGLPNRELLHQRLSEALIATGDSGREVAVLFIDLDGFKAVNDTGGHAAGDAVLVQTAQRITAALRPQDTVARVGGDEFIVIAEAQDRDRLDPVPPDPQREVDRSFAFDLVRRITTAVAEPLSVGNAEFRITASIGMSFAAGHEQPGALTAESLMQEADTAMYEAKARGRSR